MKEDDQFSGAASLLGERISRTLERVPRVFRRDATEIRLRLDRPLCLTTPARPLFVNGDGSVAADPGTGTFLVTREDLQESFVSLCGWAVHSHQREMTDGYISVRGGHRAGIAATAAVEDGRIRALRDVTSINLRIARQVYGAADKLVQGCFSNGPSGLLIAGPPASGKTTLLRDLARQLSSGADYLRVCVVDESGEIGGASGGTIQNDLGIGCDLLSGYPKEKGLQIAVRCLSPQVLICDEVASIAEIAAIEAAANCGVAVVTSIHADGFEELLRKPAAKRLLKCGAFRQAALLEGSENPCQIREIKRVDMLWN